MTWENKPSVTYKAKLDGSIDVAVKNGKVPRSRLISAQASKKLYVCSMIDTASAWIQVSACRFHRRWKHRTLICCSFPLFWKKVQCRWSDSFVAEEIPETAILQLVAQLLALNSCHQVAHFYGICQTDESLMIISEYIEARLPLLTGKSGNAKCTSQGCWRRVLWTCTCDRNSRFVNGPCPSCPKYQKFCCMCLSSELLDELARLRRCLQMQKTCSGLWHPRDLLCCSLLPW